MPENEYGLDFPSSTSRKIIGMPTNSPLAISDTVSWMAMVFTTGAGGEIPLAWNTAATSAPGALS